MIISPCISICKTDPVTGYCYGCGRSNDDKKNGKMKKQPISGKLKILNKYKKGSMGGNYKVLKNPMNIK